MLTIGETKEHVGDYEQAWKEFVHEQLCKLTQLDIFGERKDLQSACSELVKTICRQSCSAKGDISKLGNYLNSFDTAFASYKFSKNTNNDTNIVLIIGILARVLRDIDPRSLHIDHM